MDHQHFFYADCIRACYYAEKWVMTYVRARTREQKRSRSRHWFQKWQCYFTSIEIKIILCTENPFTDFSDVRHATIWGGPTICPKRESCTSIQLSTYVMSS